MKRHTIIALLLLLAVMVSSFVGVFSSNHSVKASGGTYTITRTVKSHASAPPISVVAGENISIHATGIVTPTDGSFGAMDPNGTTNCDQTKMWDQSAPCYSLVGQIDNLSPRMAIGANYTFQASVTGQLELYVNDDVNNFKLYTGGWTVTVTMDQNTEAPTGKWITPTNGFQYQPGTMLQLHAEVSPLAPQDPLIDQINFIANYAGTDHPITCSSSSLDTTNWWAEEATCEWIVPANVPSTMTLSFQITDLGGGYNLTPASPIHGISASTPTPTPSPTPVVVHPSSAWVFPSSGFTFVQGNTYTIIVQAYSSHSTDPAISYVDMTGFWSNAWHVICHIPNDNPALGNYYYCSTNFKVNNKYPLSGKITLSSNVYDVAGNKTLSAGGSHSGTFSTSATMLSTAVNKIDPKVKTVLAAQQQAPLTIGQIWENTKPSFDCASDFILEGLGKVFHSNQSFAMVEHIHALYNAGDTLSVVIKDKKTGKYAEAVIEVGKSMIPFSSCADIPQVVVPVMETLSSGGLQIFVLSIPFLL